MHSFVRVNIDKMLPKHFTASKISLIGSESLFSFHYLKKKVEFEMKMNDRKLPPQIAFRFAISMWYTANVLNCIVIGQWKWVENTTKKNGLMEKSILNRHNQSIANELHWMRKWVYDITHLTAVSVVPAQTPKIGRRVSRTIAERKWMNIVSGKYNEKNDINCMHASNNSVYNKTMNYTV